MCGICELYCEWSGVEVEGPRMPCLSLSFPFPLYSICSTLLSVFELFMYKRSPDPFSGLLFIFSMFIRSVLVFLCWFSIRMNAK